MYNPASVLAILLGLLAGSGLASCNSGIDDGGANAHGPLGGGSNAPEANDESVAEANGVPGSGSPSTGSSDPGDSGAQAPAPEQPPGEGGWTRKECARAFGTSTAKSAWVFPDADNRLSYKTLPQGDQILDFSSAGYMGGGVALPQVSGLTSDRYVRVEPSGNDDTSAIQHALEKVAALIPNAAGLRGAVMLKAGSYDLSGSLDIQASGVVLHGAGSGANGTVIHVSGNSRTIVTMRGSGSRTTSGGRATITDKYVPAGGWSFTVNNASGFAAGDAILVERPVTAAWIKFMGMDKLVRDGKTQTWISPGAVFAAERTIQSIKGNVISLDIPMHDSIDANYVQGASIVKASFAGRISQVGMEGLKFVGSYDGGYTGGYKLLQIDAVQDAWIRDVSFVDFNSGMGTGDGAKRITFDSCAATFTRPGPTSGARPSIYSVNGHQLLFVRCSAKASGFIQFTTQSLNAGPNVVLDHTSNGSIEGHQRWATGLLVDRSNVGAVNFYNRGILGSGHGWTLGWSVTWNTRASAGLLIQKPPGVQNWAIGSTGELLTSEMPGGDRTVLPTGIIDSPNVPVTPDSLYLAQLCLRLGPGALGNIGYH